ncbi:NtaA/DmoA family FMN-dependent monooxygenase [Microbacterium invictum]|uniref:FMN-dependent oxidoreductase (Nitrilotriacetate monooxygenase family) n=1 Tax=Microbacterium invictum TaxID=515415 RepID=A0AA40SPZ9_9MICO|nr:MULTISPECIES: NtaA/DmoA family FMN-dependent monooxygenase [Microbacterium]MBB4140258.1 FMN-dependent oxidoreductase (nitrilotriacetate monooxygenase family) [Microbacterium invictum]
MTRDTMSLVLFYSPFGRLNYSWRRPSSRAEDVMTLDYIAGVAREVEAARFDAIFLADKLRRDGTDLIQIEPLTTLGALSAVTEHIGLVATVSTTFSEPYNVARMLTQIDFLSRGRAAVNIVTSTEGEENFSRELPAKAERYRIAQDWLDAAVALWDGWEPDAVLVDREANVWADTSKMHPADHVGPYFRVAGPMTVPRSPQGRPVIVQAGQSPEGVDYGARNAEVIFTAKNEFDEAVGFAADMRARADTFGRDGSALRILPGVVPIVGSTDAEAQEIANEIAELYELEDGIAYLSLLLLDVPLDDLDPDAPIPVERLLTLEEAESSKNLHASRYPNIHRIIVEERPTLREMVRTRAKATGHQFLIGSASTIADEMEHWFRNAACDGFTIIPPYMPEGVTRICRELVPELQRRGIFRTEYPGTTLRDTLGIA